MEFDYVIVGAGLSGASIANILAKNNKKVLVLERRNVVGGNLYDEKDSQSGIIVQRYGPHIFHTNNFEVFSFITSFSIWKTFYLKCGVCIDGVFSPSPFNFKSVELFFKDSYVSIINELKKEYPDVSTITILELLNSKNDVIRDYANYLFDKDYSLYTSKQWGIKPSEVDVNVLKRVPVRLDYKEQYFVDKYQLMPSNGFSEVINEMLNHPNIVVNTNIDALKYIAIKSDKIQINLDGCQNSKIVYTGALDELFGYKYGLLPYRSLEFKYEHLDSSLQDYPVVAYPSEPGYTRITDYSMLPEQTGKGTVIAKEYPKQYKIGSETDPYYPINNEFNNNLYNKYLGDANKIKNLYLSGRLALYKYLNMDQVIEYSLKLCRELINEKKNN